MLLNVSGLHSLSSPPLHPLTSRGITGEDRAPRDMMVLPCGWAPSIACSSERIISVIHDCISSTLHIQGDSNKINRPPIEVVPLVNT